MTCPDEVGPADFEALATDLTVADAAAERAPAPVAIFLETIVLYDRAASVLLPNPGPRLDELIARAEEIALRHESRIRRHPREIGMGTGASERDGNLLGDLRGFGNLLGN